MAMDMKEANLTFVPHHGIKEGVTMYDILNITSQYKPWNRTI